MKSVFLNGFATENECDRCTSVRIGENYQDCGGESSYNATITENLYDRIRIEFDNRRILNNDYYAETVGGGVLLITVIDDDTINLFYTNYTSGNPNPEFNGTTTEEITRTRVKTKYSSHNCNQ